MLINLSELFTCEGKSKVFTADFSLSAIQFGGEEYRILEKEPIQLKAVNTGARKFTVEGNTVVTVEIPCARCLEPVACQCELDLCREFETGSQADEQADELDEKSFLNGYNLDVDQLVCNELLLSLPMKVLCKEDCKGICNRCGTNLNYGTCACDTRSLDPRMSVIQDIFRESKEV